MADDLVKQPIHWISTVEELEECCERWQSKKLLAVDTEFMRSQTYYPIAGLIQVNDGEANYLLDPTTIDDFSPFAEILVDDDIIKAIHSCSEDLEVFYHSFGFLPQRLFDTQIAGAFVNLGYSMGFARMVQGVLGVELPKTETRSDWLQRPLSVAQKHYAALDVEYLYLLAGKLLTELKAKERLDWVFGEGKTIVKNFSDNLDPKLSYLRAKNAWKLNAKQLAIFQNLCEWRELTAQKRDKPRNRIVKENTLFAMALKRPKHISQLRNYEGMSDRVIRTDGEYLLRLIERADKIEVSDLPELLPKPLTSAENKRVKALRAEVQKVADEIGIASEILARKKEYDYIVRDYLARGEWSYPEGFPQWRQALLTDLINETIKVEPADEVDS
ncbi:ribonuclease D [Saccharophagus degradans]|uniref:Ribonuclease D n=1 Tax=Saccharophagus degradans TaxID=86304 RepID=A0AAW7X3U4_9GAMM|nr:ribonuclease D [Saccharophagus degradans]MDO6421985.1 ribonuclease D [Saccharophagus degradans]MDO6606322.1 ribonuclease D [Saccharophagus degradans]